MTERERWIVYPLLFLALGIAMRSKITSSLDLHEISCHVLKSRTVEIVGEDGRLQLIVASFPAAVGGGGVVKILSAAGKEEVMLRALPQGGLVEVASADGVPQVVSGVVPQGGLIQTFDARGNLFRAIATFIDPRPVGRARPAPAPAAEDPKTEGSSEPAVEPPNEKSDPSSEKPATGDGPAAESSGANDEPAK